ncbi:hypothetical protein AQUCO_01000143v1 [Aquilegia coerulea]|uniref:RRM domain-containing protein n=1 Tax=Aquilegia coerulea TaxID=218851 RepID=A0A2G5E8F8_AQUCA|nr:hypothetical protein AQUCO_01000143v1 [Aquilegia coerulea]PIA52058.1 hypothetical protein AQUCO_01000143v1 [Aquilegia coerulea]
MPPRAVRRPSTATPLKKRPHAIIPIENNEEESKEVSENFDSSKNSNHESHHQEHSSSPPPPSKEDKEPEVFQENDGSERLELGDNYYHYEVEDDGVTNPEVDEYRDEIENEEVEYDEERIDGDETMDGIMQGEEEEEGGIAHGEEVHGDEAEHHDVMKERRKRKEFEVFVGGLDREATDEDLRKVFCQVGEVTEVRLMKNPLTQKNKGFAFIRFATVEQARRAVNELKHPTVNGKQCGVSPSQDSDTLFVGNICKTWTKAVLKEKLVQYGVEKFEELTLVEDTKNEGMNRGFAFLDFACRPDALEACKRLQKMDVVFGTDRTAKVAFADTFIEPDDEIMAQVKTVFLDGLPASWNEDRVAEHVNKFGKVEKVELARNMPAAKRTDFGFVTFDTHDAAVGCVDGVNNTELGDGDKKVKVRARLSRPRQRGKSSRHARGGYMIGHDGGRGGRTSWGSSGPHSDSWRFAGRSGRDIHSHRPYTGGFRRPLGPRDRYPDSDVAPSRVESRRRVPSMERSYDRRSPGLAYARSRSKREDVRSDGHYPRSSGFISGARSSDFVSKTRSSDFAGKNPTERRWSYRDAYPSRESEYLDSPPRTAPRAAARRPPPLYAEESYGRHMERPSSYRGSQHNYDSHSLSGLKRPHSSMEEYHSRFPESTHRQARARFDYSVANDEMPYSDRSYGSDSTTTRLGRGSNVGYDRGSRSSAVDSHGLYDTHTSSTSYSRDEVRRGDIGGTYSSYDRDYPSRDYTSTETEVGTGSYSSLYSSRRMGDAYASGRGSGSYY